MKKLLSVCLVLVMMLSVFSVTASAQGVVAIGYYDAKINDLYYNFYDDEATVVGYELVDEYTPQGEIVIPETVKYWGKNYTVTTIETQAFTGSTFTKITLPSTINSIYDSAFENSMLLEKVVIPEECYFNYFGDYVFTGTPYEAEIYSKEEAIFGQNVLFAYTGNGDPYVMPDNIDFVLSNCFFMSGVKSVVLNEKITSIPYCAFASCRNLKEITIPDSVEYISEGAFKDCINLEKVTLGQNVYEIGYDCFANTKINSIHLGPNVNYINGAFNDCKYLETITIDPANETYFVRDDAVYSKYYYDLSDGLDISLIYLEYYINSKTPSELVLDDDVVAIGAFAFYNNKNIRKLSGKTIGIIDAYAFNNSTIEEFDADMLMYVGANAFRNCKNLASIDLHNVWEFGISAFENCTSLTDVTFSESVYNIGELAFANTGIKNVTIYGDDCYIYEAAFKGCKELESVKLEEGVVSVGTNAFLDCPKLKTIYLSKTVQYFDENAFNGCDNVTFELIKNTTAYKHIKNNTDFDFEVVGNYSLWQRIIDFFRSLFGLD